MKVVIKNVTKQSYDYIIDSLSGNFGWDPITSIAPEAIARFIHKDTSIVSTDPVLYDLVLTDECRLETKSDHITLRFREHLATLDSKDFEKVVIE